MARTCQCAEGHGIWNMITRNCETCFLPIDTGDVSGKLGHAEGAEMTEAEFLDAYEEKDYPRPSVTVDLVIFTVLDRDLKVLLIKRAGHPFRGSWALPGGFVDVKKRKKGVPYDPKKDQGEDLDAAAHRELEEETHLPKGSCYLEQLYTFGKAGRDPRTRVIDVAYYALVRPTLAPLVTAGDDADAAEWVSVQVLVDSGDIEQLAFDHRDILQMAVQRIRGKIDYSPIAFDLVPDTFTVNELREVYEAVKGRTYDGKTFHRKFRRMLADEVIQAAPGSRSTGGRRAMVYSFRRG